MVIKQFESPVQLAGRGNTFRQNQNYEPGEYRIANNVVLDRNGQLKNRPPVQGYWAENNSSQRLGRIVGNFGADAVIAQWNGDIYQARIVSYRRCSTDPELVTFRNNACSVHPSGAAGSTKTATVLGYFIYNNEAYAIVNASFRPAASNDLITFVTVMKGTITSFYQPSSLSTLSTVGAQVINSVTLSGVFTNPATYYTNNKWAPSFFVRDWLLYKDRLWLGIGDTLYFSEAGNLQNFTAPLGGFTKFPGDSLVSLSALGDTIYTVHDSRIYAVSYNEDFNTDGQVTLVSDVIGGEDSVTYGDSVYVVNAKSLYRVDGLNVNRVLDLEINFPNQRILLLDHNGTSFTQGQIPNFKIQAFEDSLYIIPRFIKYAGSSAAISPFDVEYTAQIAQNSVPVYSFDGENPGCISINMINGFISLFSWGSNGTSYDCFFIPNNDSLNQSRLFFLGIDWFDLSHSFVFSMGSYPNIVGDATNPINPIFGTDIYNVDSYCSKADPDALKFEVPGTTIYLSNLALDDLRYFVKKLRSIELEMTPPSYRAAGGTYKSFLWLYVFAGDSTAQSIPTDPVSWPGLILSTQLISSSHTTDGINDRTLRFGLNQRAKRYSIVITTKVPGVSLPSYPIPDPLVTPSPDSYPINTIWDISDIRTLWTDTARGSTNKTDDSL